MDKIRKHLGIAIGTVIGLAAGFLYWKEIGCTSGSCPITSSPVNSSIYGAVMGGLGASIFKK
ncbi:MAG: hypothetical protein JNM78_07975 [Cyclobacteriaceae bacterium]|nr:hypothetical protein [Cyclobacteriaceae bacterium]